MSTKHPKIVKPIGSIVAMAAAAGIIAWLAFGIVSPDTYMIPPIQIEESKEIIPVGPTFGIQILENSAQEGNPDYDPDVAIVQQGDTVKWTNVDTVPHTVTSSEDFGETFDSSLISAGEVYTLDTTNLGIGEYEYLCIVHPWMVATLIIEESNEAVKITIPEGAAIPEDGQIYYDPQTIDVTVGTTIQWENLDNTIHTVTSGDPDIGINDVFDSDVLSAGDKYEFTFTDLGSQDYYCIFHPWMIGTINVE